MIFNNQLLFFFSALGAFNGLLLSFYFLFVAKPRHISNRFLGALLLMLSIRIGKSVFFYFNPDLSFHYLQFGLTACFFIGPFLYFYIKSIVQSEGSIKFSWKYHLYFLVPIVLIVGYLYPFETNVKLWRRYIINAIYFQWLFYIILSAFVLKDTIKKVFKSNEKLKSIEIWLLSIITGCTLILAAYFSFNFTYYIVGALTFSFLFYLLLLFLFFNKKKRSIIFNTVSKYADKKIESSKVSLLVEQLNSIILEKELYRNANLKSSDVATHLKISLHQFSQLLNDNLGKNFPVFINEYRISKAKEMIKIEDNLTLETIGYECGFNSKSTFYTAFKKLTGTTPAKFKDQF